LNYLNEDFCPHRVRDVTEYEVEEELTLYDPRGELVHILNPAATILWRLCDGASKVSDIVAQLAEAYDLAPEVVEADVRDVLSRFFQAGLLR
jgi:hypothetical protein